MTTVYFVRHAEPDLSNHNDLSRQLSKKGLADFNCKLPKGESLRETQQRNIRALKFVIKSHEKQRVIVASHGNAIGTVINYFDPTFDYLKFKSIRPIMPFIAKFSFSDSFKQYRIIKLL